ncbi:CGI121 protein [Xylariaceae sp. FL0016]|nr:CGI121 protein [Xylariaceae sp. FL0016]
MPDPQDPDLPSDGAQGSLETIPLCHLPASHSVHVVVFRDVSNASFLQEQLLGRNPEFEYAFVDASTVTSRLQILSAVFRAITTEQSGHMKTPNVHSEIVCSLSPTNNISEAYRRYGITPASKHIVVVKVLVSPSAGTAQDVEAHLRQHIEGRMVPFADEMLAQFTDWSKVRKYYKLNGVGCLDGVKDEAAKTREMEMLMLGGMALRGL